MMKIKINRIVPRSLVDGPGARTVVFVQGCTLACPGCQNQHLWPADGGREADAEDLALTLALLAGKDGNVTISGGEPFQQALPLLELVEALKFHGVESVLVYTGYTWNELNDRSYFSRFQVFQEILLYVDILVDGRFVRELDDSMIAWRGSRNQRPIDVQASMRATDDSVVLLDWDTPQVLISESGDLFLPVGLAGEFSDLGQIETTRRCGQTR